MSKKKEVTEIDDEFDWGFSVVDEDELPSTSAALQDAESLREELQCWETKAWKIYEMIQPLLKNLSQNPEKDYILWPNRIEKIEQFNEKMRSVLEEND